MKHALIILLSFFTVSCKQQSSRTVATGSDSLYQQLLVRMENNKPLNRIPELQVQLDTLITLTQKYHPEKLVYYLTYKGYLHGILGNSDSARKYLATSQWSPNPRKQKDTIGYTVMMGLTVLYLFEVKMDSAMQTAMEGYLLSKDLDSARKLQAIDILCNIYITIGDTTNVRRYIEEGLALHPPDTDKSVLLSYLAAYYDQIGKRDSAILIFQEVVASTPDFNVQLKAVNYGNMASFKLNNGMYLSALVDQRYSLKLFHSIGWVPDQAYGNMAELFVQLGKPSLALIYYDSAIARARELTMYNQIEDYSQAAASLLVRNNDYKRAYGYLTEAIGNIKSRDSIAHQVKLQEVETRLGVRLKDQQIINLDIATKAAEASSRQRISIIIGLCVVMVLAAVIAILLFRRQRLQRQLSEYQLEQRLLRTQMEPHFIFNALSQLQAFIQSLQIDKSLAYLNKFSRLLKVILVNTRKGFIPLQDEIEAMESYLYLLQINYEEQFSFELDIYPGYKEDGIFIPPMVIQPFVENAFNHGIRKLDAGGKISIHITRSQNTIHCRIEDNGPGIGERTTERDRPSLSTKNTQDRLALLKKETGTPASLSIVNKKQDQQTGVIVDLIIPFRFTPLGN